MINIKTRLISLIHDEKAKEEYLKKRGIPYSFVGDKYLPDEKFIALAESHIHIIDELETLKKRRVRKSEYDD